MTTTAATIESTYPVSVATFIFSIFAPSCTFMFLSLPVKRKNILQEAILALLWFTELCVPIYYAGQFNYLCLMSCSVWAWASSMKMGVWVFSMSMEERRQRPFIFTLSDWRKRIAPATTPTSVKPRSSFSGGDYMNPRLGRLLFTIIKHQLYFDICDFLFNYGDNQLPIRVFSAFLSKICSLLGQTSKAASLAPAEPLTYNTITISILMCMLFCVYIQFQLQVTYDIFMLVYAIIYKLLPTLEKWQLGEDSKKLHTQNIVKTKAILKRLRYVRAVKTYIEDTLSMPPLFDSPWSAHSLRDFWGRRWHTFYNDCFYRLGYRPIRWVVQLIFNCKAPRWLPALSVFVLSGIMHEYFLYAATGPSLYFGSPLPACGWQFIFFVIQVLGIGVGDKFFNRGILGQMYTIFYMALTSHLFVVPYILTGYLYMERFSFYRLAVNYYQGNSLFASIF
jgi:hypothetical protein